ncbi:hypothetical protein ABZ135_01345 [Streptomyces sp. NPDC006339]|uniref:hypothetical protein n=1 Tax=Streptomyces sp. NPDC006339 TaxID=3156755 RepID=UPI0033A041EA
MGFIKKTADSIAADLASGDTARIEQAAKDYVHALLEGPGTASQNASALAEAVKKSKKK